MRRPHLLVATLAATLSAVLVAGATPAVAAGTADTPTAKVRGVVTDAAGKPVANVTVAARLVPFPGAVAVRTDSRGRYSFTVTDQPSGFTEYNICAAGNTARQIFPEILPTAQDQQFDRVCSDTIDIEAAASYTVDLTVARRATVSGVVTDDQGVPMANVQVVGCPWEPPSGEMVDGPDVGDKTLTDSRGRYTLSMPSGKASVSASKEGYRTVYYQRVRCNDPEAEAPLVIQSATAVKNIDLKIRLKANPVG